MIETIEVILYNLAKIVFILIAMKAVTFGSDFNFHLWRKHKRLYWDWYWNREDFDEYMDKEMGK